MSDFAHPDKFRFYADFTGADGRRRKKKKGERYEELSPDAGKVSNNE